MNYEDYSSEDFLAFEQAMSEDEIRSILTKIPLKGTVVDIGCGPGTYLDSLQLNNCRYIGVEPSAFLRKVASEKADKLGINVEFKEGTAQNLKLDDNCADVILSTYAFNEIPAAELEKAMQEIKRIAKPGCLFLFCDLTGGEQDEYYDIINAAEQARGILPSRETADVWRSALTLIAKECNLVEERKVKLTYTFSSKDEALKLLAPILPDIKTNEKVKKAVSEVLEEPVIRAEAYYVRAEFK